MNFTLCPYFKNIVAVVRRRKRHELKQRTIATEMLYMHKGDLGRTRREETGYFV